VPPLDRRVFGISLRELLWACIPAFLLAVTAVAFYGPSASDDVYITLSAAQAFGEYGVFSNLNGDAIEQSTSLFQVLLLTPFAMVLAPEQLPLVAWALSVGFFVLALVVGFIFMRQSVSFLLALAGTALLGLVPSLHFWSSSGMETSLALFLVLCLMLWAQCLVSSGRLDVHGLSEGQVGRAVVGSTLVLVLFAVRPDVGVYTSSGIALYLLLTGWRARRRIDPIFWLWAIVTATLVGGLTALRMVVTGSPLPQSVMAKSGRPIGETLIAGWEYVTQSSGAAWFPLAAGVVLALVVTSATSGKGPLLVGCMLVSAAVGVIFSGGDWMRYGRFLVVMQVLTVMLLILLLAGIGRSKKLLVGGAVTVAMLTMSWEQVREGTGSPIYDRYSVESEQALARWSEGDVRFNRWNYVHHRDLLFLNETVEIIEDLLEVRDVITVGSGQAGMVIYYLKGQFGDRVRFIDRWSLSTDDFSCGDMVPTVFGKTMDVERWVETAGECSPPLPDVMFDLRLFPPALENDYQVVAKTSGRLVRGTWNGTLNQWLAVRNDLVEK